MANNLHIVHFSLSLFLSSRRGKKHSIVLRTQLSVRVHACIGEFSGAVPFGLLHRG